MTAPIDLVLARLDNPKPAGKDRWRSACPSCGGNRNGFSVGVGDDDAVLIRCWKGCSADAAVHAMGLEMADLFPSKPQGHGTAPVKRRHLLQAGQALELLEAEMTLAVVCASDMAAGKGLDDATRDRLLRGAARVAMLRDEVRA